MSEPGDVVVVPYPFTDQTRAKLRPVLVITAPDSQGDFVGLGGLSGEMDQSRGTGRVGP